MVWIFNEIHFHLGHCNYEVRKSSSEYVTSGNGSKICKKDALCCDVYSMDLEYYPRRYFSHWRTTRIWFIRKTTEIKKCQRSIYNLISTHRKKKVLFHRIAVKVTKCSRSFTTFYSRRRRRRNDRTSYSDLSLFWDL